MHDIEPFYRWRDKYIASEDELSPFFGKEYDEFKFTNRVYNYYIHPQWDEFGSATLYLKILYANYDRNFVVLELIGEWNDCLYNDIMYLKREVIDLLLENGIHKFILICENVLNFHGDDDSYYEEWYEEVRDESGWICFLNTLEHVSDEMESSRLYQYIHYGNAFSEVNWRTLNPGSLLRLVESLLSNEMKLLDS
ncbi:MAG TPA: hypothetical protein PKA00_16265 [Saprospiraceae bacterium]|nr:hypothetical protein [Saprospiraceae bacterium]HMQ84470.1 hypothetical protein [Saprospiraceae bacterium]